MKNKLDPKLAKWVSWSQEILRETQSLMIKTKLYDDYVEVVKANKSIQSPDDFHQWTMRNYFDSALMSIRRLLDTNKSCISLINLMGEIKCYHHLITKDFYLKDLPKGDGKLPVTRDFASQWFDDNFSKDSKRVSQEIVESHIAELKKQTDIVENFIDNTLAHKNKGGKGKQSIQTTKVREAIQNIEEIAIKYIDLLGQGSYSELTPTWQYDHLSIFTKPWIIPKSNAPQKQTTERDIDDFLKQVDLIRDSTFIKKYKFTKDKLFRLSYKRGSATKIETQTIPPREVIESFIMRIRPIVVKKERLFLEEIAQYSLAGKGAAAEKTLSDVLRVFRQQKQAVFSIVSDGYELTPPDFIWLYLYAEYFHVDTEKRDVVSRMKSSFGDMGLVTALSILQGHAELAILVADSIIYLKNQDCKKNKI